MEPLARTFPPEPTSPRQARRFVVDALGTFGLERHGDAAALLVSELVTNAVLHAATDVTVTVSAQDDRARIEVADGSPLSARRRQYSPDAATGRGIQLVDGFASSWGSDVVGSGKTVWFELGDVRAESTGHREHAEKARVSGQASRSGAPGASFASQPHATHARVPRAAAEASAVRRVLAARG